MSLKRNIGVLLRCLGINLLLLAAAAVLDILLSALMFRSSSRALTIVSFAVAGVFSAVCCFGSGMERIAKGLEGRAARYLMMEIAAVGALLFLVLAPLSGWDYNWPVKFFAITETATAVFLWKNKFYSSTDAPGGNGTN
ncbi:hypothetical protein [Niabella aurantiaca]|uniref:hypothetical protein n=1 Tax=Niabella aurantiaca TaxID=379900 RepID=UPI000366F677|nr:hypothetical protein [Niabella aurantiaca]